MLLQLLQFGSEVRVGPDSLFTGFFEKGHIDRDHLLKELSIIQADLLLFAVCPLRISEAEILHYPGQRLFNHLYRQMHMIIH